MIEYGTPEPAKKKVKSKKETDGNDEEAGEPEKKKVKSKKEKGGNDEEAEEGEPEKAKVKSKKEKGGNDEEAEEGEPEKKKKKVKSKKEKGGNGDEAGDNVEVKPPKKKKGDSMVEDEGDGAGKKMQGKEVEEKKNKNDDDSKEGTPAKKMNDAGDDAHIAGLHERPYADKELEHNLRTRFEKMDDRELEKAVTKVKADRPLLKKYLKEVGLTKEEMKGFVFGDEDALEELVDFELWCNARGVASAKPTPTAEKTQLSQQPTIDYTQRQPEPMVSFADGAGGWDEEWLDEFGDGEAGCGNGCDKRMKQTQLEDCEAVLRWPRVYTYTVQDTKPDASIQTTLEEHWCMQGEGEDEREKKEETAKWNPPGL